MPEVETEVDDEANSKLEENHSSKEFKTSGNQELSRDEATDILQNFYGKIEIVETEKLPSLSELRDQVRDFLEGSMLLG